MVSVAINIVIIYLAAICIAVIRIAVIYLAAICTAVICIAVIRIAVICIAAICTAVICIVVICIAVICIAVINRLCFNMPFSPAIYNIAIPWADKRSYNIILTQIWMFPSI
jgi:hypothetical protein